jgi:hypothetical protein
MLAAHSYDTIGMKKPDLKVIEENGERLDRLP